MMMVSSRAVDAVHDECQHEAGVVVAALPGVAGGAGAGELEAVAHEAEEERLPGGWGSRN